MWEWIDVIAYVGLAAGLAALVWFGYEVWMWMKQMDECNRILRVVRDADAARAREEEKKRSLNEAKGKQV